MMKKTVLFTCLKVILLCALLKAVSTAPVEAAPKTWTVDDDGPADFSSIQEAINSLSVTDGDTIFVHSGTYYENLVVNKAVSLIGEEKETTIIDGNEAGSVIFLTANNVTITGFTVQNGTYGLNMNQASNCTINGNKITSNEEDGMMIVWESNNNIISNNVMNANGAQGIRTVYSSSQNKITGNLLKDNKIGMLVSNCRNYVLRDNNITSNIYNFGVLGSSPIDFIHDIDISNVVDEKPIYYLIAQSNLLIDSSTSPNMGYLALVNSDNITVRDLDPENNYQGVLFANTTDSSIENVTASHNFFGIHLVFSDYNTINNNLAKPSVEGVTGIHLVNSKYNTLARNEFDSCQVGIQLFSYSLNNTIVENEVSNNQYGIHLQASSSGNLIYHNSFINNTEQAMIDLSSYSIWDNGYPSGGNFWSDYTGEDSYSGPDQNETGSDGIGDVPYVIDGYNQDNYPLMTPYILLGDANHDGAVDIYDLGMIEKTYGSEPGDSNWNPDCDLNDDGIADIFDLATVGKNYGKTS